MPIYVPKEESSFARLHEDILAGRTLAYSKSSRLVRRLQSNAGPSDHHRLGSIVVDLKLFQGIANQIVGEHPALLSDVPVCSRLGFADVALPDNERNDVYIQLCAGSFSSALSSITTGTTRLRRSLSAASSGNIQVTLEVRHPDGSVIPGCLHAGGVGEPPLTQYHSMVFVGNDRPTFGENVKLSLSRDIADCHLFFAFRSRGSKTATNDYGELELPFAHAFVPLIADGAILQDGSHEIALYKMDQAAEYSPLIYLTAQQSPSGGANGGVSPPKGMIPMRDRLSIRTLLCSTIHSQDPTLRKILRYGMTPMPGSHTLDLEGALSRFSFVTENEISKFVQPVLNALLAFIIHSSESDTPKLQVLALQAMVKVLSLSHDRRCQKLPFSCCLSRSALRSALNASALLLAVRRSAKTPAAKEFRLLLKVWHVVMRIASCASRELLAEGSRSADTEISLKLAKENDGITDQVRDVLDEPGHHHARRHDKALIGTQTS